MFEIFFGASYILPIVMLLIWMIVCVIAANLPFTTNNQSLKAKRNLILAVSSIALLASVLWLTGVLFMLVQNGWLFVEGTIKVMLPLLLIGNISVVYYSFPRLLLIREKNKEPLSPETLVHVTNPWLLVPIYAAALASGIMIYLNFFAHPIKPGLGEIVLPLVSFLLILLISFFFTVRKRESILNGQLRSRSFLTRLYKSALATFLFATVLIIAIVIRSVTGIQASKLPDASNMMHHHTIDDGGGAPTRHTGKSHHVMHNNHTESVEVKDLTGDLSVPAEQKFELVAEQKEISLPSGKKINAWTYNGEIAPQIRVKHGEMIEVKLINNNIDKGVTIHWHGYNVPNAMDGVPGMTQNAVKPGETFTYKFRAEQVGTYWFHSHQQSAEQVKKGLFGSLIVDPKDETDIYDEDLTVINHKWQTDNGYTFAFGSHDEEQTKQVKPGQKVRVRVINTDNLSRKYLLQGVDYIIYSIDGVPIGNPETLTETTAFRVPSGGRYDVIFTMPDHPVVFKITNNQDQNSPSIVFQDGPLSKKPGYKVETDLFDPARYGTPVTNELTNTNDFDREFQMIFGNEMGFFNGSLHFLWTINGEVYPNTPTLVVKEGEKIKTTLVNKSFTEHPIHLHGHHITVLKKNGKKVETPWMTDTLNVQTGESYEVAFITNNPGMWMDHCHNLDHAAVGMTLHLMYDNVLPSYETGTRSGNLPE